MAIAILSSLRSKDPSKQVGACIVGKNKIIEGIGYNGFPRGCDDSHLPWAKRSNNGLLGTKYPYVVHAEANALLNTNRSDVRGSSIYVTMTPCNECAKLLIQAGIQEVIYMEGKDVSENHVAHAGGPRNTKEDANAMYAAAAKMFKMAGVQLRQLKPSRAVHVDMWA
eukprot:jgi/Ulvmu1/3226/UM015_0267.1